MTKDIFKQVLDDLRINFIVSGEGYKFTYNHTDIGNLSKNPFLIHFYSTKDLSIKLIPLFNLLALDVEDMPHFLNDVFETGVTNREYLVSIITIKTLQEVQCIKRSVDVPKSVQLMYEDVVNLLDGNILKQLDLLEEQRQSYLRKNKINEDAQLEFRLKTQLRAINKEIFMDMKELTLYMQYRKAAKNNPSKNCEPNCKESPELPEYQQLADTLTKGLRQLNPELFDTQNTID